MLHHGVGQLSPQSWCTTSPLGQRGVVMWDGHLMILRIELAAQDEGDNAMADVPSIEVAEVLGKHLRRRARAAGSA